jgi:hypothetical protein
MFIKLHYFFKTIIQFITLIEKIFEVLLKLIIIHNKINELNNLENLALNTFKCHKGLKLMS